MERTAINYGSITDLRLRLLQQGYLPVPISAPWLKVKAAGKRPLFHDWREVCAVSTEETVRNWAKTQRNSTNTGILTNTCRAVDVDVYDPELAQRLLALAFEFFGPTPLIRTGQAPKILGVWAGSDPFPKVATEAYVLPGGLTARVEVLAVGQQFVGFGDHPETRKPYHWDSATPLDVPVCDLESISLESVQLFCAEADRMILAAGGVPPKKGKAAKDRPAGKVLEGAESVPSSVVSAPSNVFSFSSDHCVEQWAAAAVSAEYDSVTGAPEGDRNNTLNCAAFSLGQIVGAGHLAEAEVTDLLAEAAQVAGLQADEYVPTIRSGLTAGKVRPRGPKDCEQRRPVGGRAGSANRASSTQEGGDHPTPYDVFGDEAMTGIPVMPALCVPDAIEGFARDEGERLGVDPAVIAAGCVVACASVISDDWKLQPKMADTSWTESARLWLGIIAPPSAKKTPALNSVVGPLRAMDRAFAEADEPLHEAYEVESKIHQRRMEAYTAAKAKGENVPQPVPPVKPPYRRLVVNDVTIAKLGEILSDNPAGVIAVNDELASWFASLDNRDTGAKDRAEWLSLYNGGPHVVDRIKRGTVRIPNWSACMIGTIQPGKLRELSSKMSDDGLMQRFMLVHAPSSTRGVDRVPNDMLVGRYHALVKTLKDLEPAHRERPFKFSEEAQAVRNEWLDIVELIMDVPDSPEPLRYHMGKLDGVFARLCLTYHIVDAADRDRYPPPTISGDTARRVLLFMRDLLLPNLTKFYRELFGVSQRVEHARWIAGYILANQKGRVTHRDVYRSYSSRLRDEPRIISDAMNVLDLAGWVSPVEPRNGRDVTEWTVNPVVHSTFGQRASEEKTRREAIKAKIAANAKRLNIKVCAA